MLMGAVSGALSLAILFGSWSLMFPLFLIAAVAATNYFIAMAFTPIFPGMAWCGPEFEDETGRPLGLAPQQLISYALCAAVLAAVFIALS